MLRSRWTYGLLVLALLGVLAAHLSGTEDKWLITTTIPLHLAVLGAVIWLFRNGRLHRAKLVLASLSVVVALLLVEVLLRFAVPQIAVRDYRGLVSNEYHHRLPSSVTMYHGLFEDQHVFVTTNEDGLRTKYSRREFLDHSVRIAVLGDSFTFAVGVRDDKTWPELLEKFLRERLQNSDIAVLKAGIISYSPLLESLLFDGIVKHYRPQLVVLLLDPGDIGDDFAYENEMQLASATLPFGPYDDLDDGAPVETPRFYGAVWKLTRPFWKPLVKAARYPYRFILQDSEPKWTYRYYEFEVMIGDKKETNRFFIYRHPLSETESYFNRTMGYIRKVAADCDEIDAKFVLALSPRFHHWNPKESPNNWEKEAYSLNEPFQNEFFRYFHERGAGLEIIDLLEHFSRTDRFPLVFEDDPHWNQAGNQFVAESFEAELAERYPGLLGKK